MFVLAKTYASMVYRETISVATDATNSARTFAHLKALGATTSLFAALLFTLENIARDKLKHKRLIASMAVANRYMVVYFQRSI